ncbi:hypothetical protein MRS76_19190 [Rhizobiaceae bacterium n13]|nr:hypothetical protein [Fererhizobium litorale]
MADLTPPEHSHSDVVTVAAMWLADQHPVPSPAVPLLRSRFNLSATEACEACAMAQRFRTNRRAFG